MVRIGVVALLLIARSALADILWVADFETADISQWMGSQVVDDPSDPRVLIVDAPVAQGQYALCVLVRQGDDPIHASGNRNELHRLLRIPSDRILRLRRGDSLQRPAGPLSGRIDSLEHASGA